MGLTEAKLKDLNDKEFNKLYDKHLKIWQEMVANAKQFVIASVTTNNDYRSDDLLEPLIPAVRANQLFRDHQADNKAKGTRFVTYFAEYIIDKNP